MYCNERSAALIPAILRRDQNRIRCNAHGPAESHAVAGFSDCGRMQTGREGLAVSRTFHLGLSVH
jgi:hypothetical protein